jgi:hypothetical protein
MLCLLQVQNENGKSVPGMYEWTSLTRAQILRILKNLPEKFGDLFPAPQAPKLASLFKAFLELYNDICGSSPNANEVHTKAKQWVEDFVSLGSVGKLEGFQKKYVTPYIHCMVYHVPQQLRQHGNLLQFSGQGVEKNNDHAKHNFYSSNRHDPCGEVLRTEKCLEQLESSCRRQKRPYRKRNEEYWNGRITEERASQRPRAS